MALTRIFELTLNNKLTPGQVLVKSLADFSTYTPTWVEDDKFTIRIRFAEPASQLGTPATPIPLEDDNVIILSGKKTRGTGPALFKAENFIKHVVTVEDVIVDVYYDAKLNLNTDPMEITWGTDQTLPFWVDVEVSAPDPDDVADPDRLTWQFPVTVNRQSYDGDEAVADADPVYPAPAMIAHLAAGKHLLSEIPGVIKAGNGYNPGEEDFEFKAGGTYEVKINAYEVFALEEVEGARITVVCIEDNDGNYIPAIDDSLQPGLLYEFHFVNGSWSYGFRPWVDSNSLSTGRLGATTPAGARGSIGVSNNYSAVTITGAGNTTVSAWGNARRGARRITVNAFTGAATVTLSTSSAVSDDRAELDFLMPASLGPVVTVHNATSGGTLLATIPTDAAVARTWRVIAQFTGTAWQLVSLAPRDFNEGVHSIIDPLVTSRDPRQMLVLDGTDADAAKVAITLPLGTGRFDFGFIVQSSDDAHENCLFSNRESAGGGGAGIVVYWAPNGALAFFSNSAAPPTAAFGVIPRDGKEHLCLISIEPTKITAYVDGVQTGTNSPTFPASTGNLVQVFSETTASSSSATFYGRAAAIGFTNYNLDAAQRARFFATGAFAASDRHPNGAGTQLLTGTDSDFSGAGNWVGINGGTATVTAGKLVASTLTNVYDGVGIVGASRLFFKGYRYRVTATVSSATGTGALLGDGAGAIFAFFANGTTTTYEFVAPTTGVGVVFFRWDSGSTGFSLDNVTVECLGTFAQYGAWDGTGGYWPDANGRGKHLSLGVGGVRPLLKSARSEVADGLYASSAPILSVVTQSGASHVAGTVLATLDIGGAVWGEWLVGNQYRGRYYRGGRFSDGANNFGFTTELLGSAGFSDGAYGCNVGVEFEAIDASTTRIKLVVIETLTVGLTSACHLFHLSGGLNRSFVK